MGSSIDEAKSIISYLLEEGVLLKGNYYDDIWEFENNGSKKTSIYIKFSSMKHNCTTQQLNLVKCWAANQLRDYFPENVQRKFSHLSEVIYITDFFDDKKIENLKSLFIESENSPVALRNRLLTTLNFVTYYENDSLSSYKNYLLEIKETIKVEANTRLLPKAKDVLKFSNCIDDFFKNELLTSLKIEFYPILLWWRLTNVIPIRIGEFCDIQRQCISPDNGSYYITLPRYKKPASQRGIQVVNNLEITKELYDLIDNYINITEPFGKSETLISYRALMENTLNPKRRKNKKNKDYFNSSAFSNLLRSFYDNVVYKQLGISVEREVRPNDTRHFAICSLTMQGISPIEIARLAGHTSLEAQYHYSKHTEYFIDSEIYKLVREYRRERDEIVSNTSNNDNINLNTIKSKTRKFPKDEEKLLELEIGYCKDTKQRCESEECMLCSHWWIHPRDFEKVRPKIEKKILERRQKVIEIGNFLNNLHRNFPSIHEEELHPNLFTKMRTEAASIEDYLHQIAELTYLRGAESDD
ncbi:tyrosine-type recombinase/integrase [Priestia megaterium]